MSKTYLFKYHHDSAWWTLEIPAESAEDAQERLRKIPHAQYLGELCAKVPARYGLLVRLWCWLKNKD